MKIKKRKKGYYGVGDERYPSVTTIINAMGVAQELIYWYGKLGYEEANRVKERSGIYGTKLHKAFNSFLFSDDLKIDDQYTERLIQFQEWMEKNGYIPIKGEFVVVNATHKYAGTCDLLLQGDDGRHAILDFKTGRERKWQELMQLAAYSCCDELPDITDVYSVHVGKTQDAKITITHYGSEDITHGMLAFQSLLDVYKFKKEYSKRRKR